MKRDSRRAQTSAHRLRMIGGPQAADGAFARADPRTSGARGEQTGDARRPAQPLPDARFWAGAARAHHRPHRLQGRWLCGMVALVRRPRHRLLPAATDRSDPCLRAGAARRQIGTPSATCVIASGRHSMLADHPDLVLHLAAQSLVRGSLRPPGRDVCHERHGHRARAGGVRRRGPCASGHRDSDKCYENRDWVWGYRETDALGGHDPYSSSQGLRGARHRGLPPLVLRPDGAGRRQRPRRQRDRRRRLGRGPPRARLLPRRAGAASRSASATPRPMRPWQHVLNPLSGYLRLAERAWDDRGVAHAWKFGPTDADARPVKWIVDRIAGLGMASCVWELIPARSRTRRTR